jgi:hypothetical protein
MLQGFLFGMGLIAAFVVVANGEAIVRVVGAVIGVIALILIFGLLLLIVSRIPEGVLALGALALISWVIFAYHEAIFATYKPRPNEPPIPGVLASVIDIGRAVRRWF